MTPMGIYQGLLQVMVLAVAAVVVVVVACSMFVRSKIRHRNRKMDLDLRLRSNRVAVQNAMQLLSLMIKKSLTLSTALMLAQSAAILAPRAPEVLV